MAESSKVNSVEKRNGKTIRQYRNWSYIGSTKKKLRILYIVLLDFNFYPLNFIYSIAWLPLTNNKKNSQLQYYNDDSQIQFWKNNTMVIRYLIKHLWADKLLGGSNEEIGMVKKEIAGYYRNRMARIAPEVRFLVDWLHSRFCFLFL